MDVHNNADGPDEAVSPSRKVFTGPPYFYPLPSEIDDLLSEGEELVRKAQEQLKKRLGGSLDPADRLKLYTYDGIGPVRCLYYRELILSTIYGSLLDGTPLAGTSYFVAFGVRRDQHDWLTYDRHLARILASIGISWPIIEDAILTGFHAALPLQFRRDRHPEANSQMFVDWQMTWTNRDKLRQGAGSVAAGVRKAKQAAQFLKGLEPTVSRQSQRLIRSETVVDLKNLIAMSDSIAWSNVYSRIKDFRTVRNSPLVTTIVVKVSECLWRAISSETRSFLVAGNRLAPEKYTDMNLEQGMKDRIVTTEFWMLVSDLLYHCPVFTGIPDSHSLAVENDPRVPVPYQQDTRILREITHDEERSELTNPSWHKLTEDGVRGRCEGHYNPKQNPPKPRGVNPKKSSF